LGGGGGDFANELTCVASDTRVILKSAYKTRRFVLVKSTARGAGGPASRKEMY